MAVALALLCTGLTVVPLQSASAAGSGASVAAPWPDPLPVWTGDFNAIHTVENVGISHTPGEPDSHQTWTETFDVTVDQGEVTHYSATYEATTTSGYLLNGTGPLCTITETISGESHGNTAQSAQTFEFLAAAEQTGPRFYALNSTVNLDLTGETTDTCTGTTDSSRPLIVGFSTQLPALPATAWQSPLPTRQAHLDCAALSAGDDHGCSQVDDHWLRGAYHAERDHNSIDQGGTLVGTEHDEWTTTYTLHDATAGSVAPSAVADWVMDPRTVDADGDGFVDRYVSRGRATAVVPRDGLYLVTLDGCESIGIIDQWTWTIAGQQYGSDSCALPVQQAEGSWPASLTVSGPGGSDTVEFTLEVRDVLVVGLGDSFGSGEGAPEPGDHDWEHTPCHRSTRSGQTQAALALEESDPHTSVTLIHLACTGGTVDKGILGTYKGQTPQVVAAHGLAHGQQIDAVFLSVGGNDVDFSTIITTCARFGNCPLRNLRWEGFDLSLLVGAVNAGVPLHTDIQGQLARLGGRYDQVARCLSRGLGTCRFDKLGVDPSHVFVTEYPDLVTDDDGSYCDHVLPGLGVGLSGGIVTEEFRWAREVVQQGTPGDVFTFTPTAPRPAEALRVRQPGLNRQVAGLGRLGWTPVTGYADEFVGHGYCAHDNWVTRISQSTATQGDQDGTFHPNTTGYTHQADAITDAAQTTLEIP